MRLDRDGRRSLGADNRVPPREPRSRSRREFSERTSRDVFGDALRIPGSSTGSPPYRFTQMPVDGDSRVFEKRGNERLGAPRGGDQFSENWRGYDKISAIERGVKSGVSGERDPRVRVPQGDDDIGVDRGCHL